MTIDPLAGPQPYQGRELAFKLGLTGKQVSQFAKIFMGLATLFLERDLAMVEINPLVITKQGDLVPGRQTGRRRQRPVPPAGTA